MELSKLDKIKSNFDVHIKFRAQSLQLSFARLPPAELITELMQEFNRPGFVFGQGLASSGMKFIGDWRCVNNALDPHLRCAINPSGPCGRCKDFAQRNPVDLLKIFAVKNKTSLGFLVGITTGLVIGAGTVIVFTQVLVKPSHCTGSNTHACQNKP